MCGLQAGVYQRLAALQGTAIPRLVAAGQLGYPGNGTIAFVATLHAGANALEISLGHDDVAAALWCLQQVHDLGVLHQDLHPGNVLIDTQVGLLQIVAEAMQQIYLVWYPWVHWTQTRTFS